ncbi:MAG: hypothetical protein PHV74_08175 [Dehalococcoidia bacterium]|nr:hypothetical protein [Dehalococcoidia bacterium]
MAMRKKLKAPCTTTDIPKHIKIELWRIMKDNSTYNHWGKAIARAKTLDQYANDFSATKDNYQRLKKELELMPLYEVDTLPDDLQQWIKDVRPELMDRRSESQQRINMEPLILQSMSSHFDHMSDIASAMLAGNLDKVVEGIGGAYTISDKDETYRDIPQDELGLALESNLENIFQQCGPWDFWYCFYEHFLAEFSELFAPNESDITILTDKRPYELIEALRVLARRKTFKGTCPVCKDW